MLKYDFLLGKTLCFCIVCLCSCASDVYESEINQHKDRITTAINVEEVKASGNQNISRGETKAPAMQTIKMEGAVGDMFVRFTSAAGISENDNSIRTESRGQLITNDNFYDDYGLFVYEYLSTDTWTNSSIVSATTPNIVNERVLKSRNWATNEFWPGSGSHLALYGYAPYNASGVSLLPSSTTVGKPTFHYVVPTQAVNQSDLLVSEDDAYVSGSNEDGGVDVPGDYNAIKYLKFKHACTAIRIAVGDQMAPCTIKKIAIKGVYGEADYNYGAGTGLNMGEWENYSTTKYNYELTSDFVVTATDKNKIINTGKYAFMLLPQTVPAGASLEVTIDDGETHVLKANISNNQWDAGYSVTYYLSTASTSEEYILSVSTGNPSIPGTGGSSSFSVQSYKQTFYGSQNPVAWEATYSIGTDPLTYNTPGSVVTAFTNYGAGGTTAQSSTISFGAAVPASDPTTNTHTADLRSRAVVNNVDLAAGGETANCYVVTQPGTYKFPLVWGNAIKGGVANTSAYNSDTFVDYKGNKIKDADNGPYIYNKYQPRDAVIVWQDAPDLVTPSSVKLDADKHYIEFEVKPENICQGNCVIAVRDQSFEIMWSWHIWVTDYDWESTVEMSGDNGSFLIMSAPSIGFCDSETRKSIPYAIYVYVRQQEGNRNASVSYDVGVTTKALGDNAPFFQWGRKDPFVPSTGLGDEGKKVSTYYALAGDINTTEIANTIKNPYSFNSSSGNASNELWNVGSINTNGAKSLIPVIKSIYDPSPIGFHVPSSGTFLGLGSNGRSSWQNTSGKKGRNIYPFISRVGSTVFFLANGQYNGNSDWSVVGVYGNYWQAESSSSSYANSLFFDVGGLYNDPNPRKSALAVRPVKD
jgi:hypothetical protein